MIDDDEDPSDEYIKAYNDGYQMARHEPELLREVLKSPDNTIHGSYISAMAQGAEQHEHEKLMDEMKQMRERNRIKQRRIN
jgi:hypothetical protein